ncbi:MAG: hypothetical protein KAH25_07970 [Bacteroidales bacterium]|nr:hypothetical protein [Bacteroidales bacterium]
MTNESNETVNGITPENTPEINEIGNEKHNEISVMMSLKGFLGTVHSKNARQHHLPERYGIVTVTHCIFDSN